MATENPPQPAPTDIDPSDLRFWARPLDERARAFAELRARPEPVFLTLPKLPFLPQSPGSWALVRHADVTEASRHPEIFSSEPSATSPADMPRWMDKYFNSMIDMDDPRHAKIRRIVSRAFSPKMLAKAEDARTKAQQAADTARKASATFALIGALSLVIGAFIASVAATLGGMQRDEDEAVFVGER